MKHEEKRFDKNQLKTLRHIKIQIQKLDLKIAIGLEDAAATAVCIGAIASIVAILLRKYMKTKNQNIWEVVPVYQNRNLLNIKIDGIFRIRFIHMIYTIYVVIKKGGFYGRNSKQKSLTK